MVVLVIVVVAMKHNCKLHQFALKNKISERKRNNNNRARRIAFAHCTQMQLLGRLVSVVILVIDGKLLNTRHSDFYRQFLGNQFVMDDRTETIVLSQIGGPQ